MTTFKTGVAAHVWLNDVIAFRRGGIGYDPGVPARRYRSCVADYLPGIEVPGGHGRKTRVAVWTCIRRRAIGHLPFL